LRATVSHFDQNPSFGLYPLRPSVTRFFIPALSLYARAVPRSQTSGEVDDEGTVVSARAEYDVKSRATIIEARVERGDDEAAIDFDTNTNEPGA
jgi:hypothetical protein